MSIRVKLFLTLIVFSMLPLLVTALLVRGNVRQAGEELSDSTRVRIEQIADDTRRHLVEKYAAVLERDRALIEIDVLAAADAMRRIDSVGPNDDLVPPHFYTDEDFDNPANPPPGLREDPRMQLIGADGSRTPLLVSDEVPVLVPPPGVGIESLLREASVLHEMVPVLRATRAMTEDLIRPSSQYAALDAS
ncbi:MAG: hypothetical protein AAFV43_17225, partial [Planctomycetota bacterium]